MVCSNSVFLNEYEMMLMGVGNYFFSQFVPDD